jgi:hypothetical protein
MMRRRKDSFASWNFKLAVDLLLRIIPRTVFRTESQTEKIAATGSAFGRAVRRSLFLIVVAVLLLPAVRAADHAKPSRRRFRARR